jgi:hypothetical protein
MIPTHEIIDYWLDIIYSEIKFTSNLPEVKKSIYVLADIKMLHILAIDGTGIFTYAVGTDFMGGTELSEVMFYIRKEYRGNLRLVKRYIDTIEDIAKKLNCNSIKIGANIGYKDQSFLKLLERWGYKHEVLSKKIKG